MMVSFALGNNRAESQSADRLDEPCNAMAAALTPPQARLLRFIREFVERETCPPTVREIQRGLAMSSTSLVAFHLRNLEQKGAIMRRPKAARGLTIVG